MTRRIVVTGATGFVGRQVLAPLVAHGFEVHALSRGGGFEVPGVVWHGCDILSGSLRSLLTDISPSHLLHSAWITEHGVYWHSPANHDWVAASQRLFMDFADCGGGEIIGVGSCAEYDWTVGDGIMRESDVGRPATLYGQSKLALAQWLDAFSRRSGVRQAWARLFFLFGPGEDGRRLVPYLVDCARTGTVARCTSGVQVRDFLDTEHCGAWLADLAASDVTGVVNIASGRGHSLRDLAGLVAEASGGRLKCDFGAIADRPDDPPVIVADTTRLRGLNGAAFDLRAAVTALISAG